MATKETDQFTSTLTTFSIDMKGTSPKAALDIARYFAVTIDDVLPFSVADFAGKPTLDILCRRTTQTFFALASKLKIARSQTKRQNLIPGKIGWRPKARS